MSKETRKNALGQALANSAIDGFEPSEFGRAIYEKWVDGLDVASAILLIKDHHKSLELVPGSASDGKAKSNLLGITDSARMRNAEADITTLRMAELSI